MKFVGMPHCPEAFMTACLIVLKGFLQTYRCGYEAYTVKMQLQTETREIVKCKKVMKKIESDR